MPNWRKVQSSNLIRLVIVVSIILCVVTESAYAGWGITWGGELSDYGTWLDQTDDGGYIVTGWTETLIENFGKVLLLKTNPHGFVEWTRIYGGDWDDRGYCIEQTADGCYIVTGYHGHEESGGFWDLWLLKTDENGDTLWTRTYSHENYGKLNIGYCVRQTDDGGYILTGEKGRPYSSIWLLKTDSLGDTLWTRTFNCTGGYEEFGSFVEQTSDGGFIVTGSQRYVFCLIKVDEDGDSTWHKYFYEEGDLESAGRCVRQTADGGYIVVGDKNTFGDWSTDLWLIKTDEEGKETWRKKYGDEGRYDAGYCVEQTPDSGYIIVGHTQSGLAKSTDLWLLKTDSLGDTLWTKTFGDWWHDLGRCVQQTPDGGYIMTGYTESFGNGNYDLWLIKVDSLGEIDIEEKISLKRETNWEVITSVSPQTVIKYSDQPQGFHALVLDAAGRMVDELYSPGQSGTIFWGHGFSPGVYFIRTSSDNPTITHKIVLIN